MRDKISLMGLGLVGALSLAGSVQAAPVLITGGLFFPSNPEFTPGKNFFDTTSGYVPSASANASGTTVPVQTASEFVFEDVANADGADFTDNSLTIADFTRNGAYDFYMTFTANRPHFFDNAMLVTNSFGGYIGVVGNTLTFTSPQMVGPGGTFRTATISFLGGTAAPEPATWAMMIVGFGLVGAAMRRARSVTTLVTYAA